MPLRPAGSWLPATPWSTSGLGVDFPAFLSRACVESVLVRFDQGGRQLSLSLHDCNDRLDGHIDFFDRTPIAVCHTNEVNPSS